MLVFELPLEPVLGVLPLELPLVPASPVDDEPVLLPVPLEPIDPVEPVEPVPELPDVPEAFSDVDELLLPVPPVPDEAVLPGVEVSLLLEVPEGEVELEAEGEVDEPLELPVAPLPVCDLSQPVMAAPARARTATTGMSFFMTSPIRRDV